MSDDQLDTDEREVERLLAALPPREPPPSLDARIARARPRRGHAILRVAALAAAACVAAWATLRAPTREPAAAPAPLPDPAPVVTDGERRWATVRDEGIVVIDGRPMRLLRTRAVTAHDHLDHRQRLRITCLVPTDTLSLVSQQTL
jgi:hypothetical protein